MILFPEEVVLMNFYVSKFDAAGRGGFQSDLVSQIEGGDAFLLPLNDETADSPVRRGVRVRLGKDSIEIGNIRISDKGFIAIEDVLVPLSLGTGIEKTDVTPVIRLGHGNRGNGLPFCQLGEVFFSLLFVSEPQKGFGRNGAEAECHSNAVIVANHLFHDEAVIEQGQTLSP